MSTTLNGAINASVTTVTIVAGAAPAVSGDLLLIENELVQIDGAGINAATTSITGVTRGAKHTVGASHADTTPVYNVLRAHNTGANVSIYYIDANGITQLKTVSINQAGNPVNPQAKPADYTDSSGGTPATTLVAVRSDTAAHTAADANANFASANKAHNDLKAALVTAGVLT